MEFVRETAEKVRTLEIRGARNIAIATINAIEKLASQTKAKNKKEFICELLRAKDVLFASRETEPLMRNAIRWIINQVEKTKIKR